MDSHKTVTTSNSKIWEKIDNKITELTVESIPTATSSTKLDQYIAEPTLPRTCDILHWWNDRKVLYPGLYCTEERALCRCHLSPVWKKFFKCRTDSEWKAEWNLRNYQRFYLSTQVWNKTVDYHIHSTMTVCTTYMHACMFMCACVYVRTHVAPFSTWYILVCQHC
jgi:hypothetical protein